MSVSSAFIPIIVAVIGIVGTLAPVYINSSVSTNPKIIIQSENIDDKTKSTRILNIGNAPATNVSVFISSCGFEFQRFEMAVPCQLEIHNITNGYSTADVILPQFNNANLEPGVSKTVNRSLVEIQVAKLVQGFGSNILFTVSFNNSYIEMSRIGFNRNYVVTAVYDQGSESTTFEGTSVEQLSTFSDYMYPLISWFQDYVAPLISFYVIFYAIFFFLLYRYIKRRKALKKFITGLVDNIMEVRGVLRNNRTNMDILSEPWFKKPADMKRRAIKKLTDYLIIDDFYSELRKRNLYLSKNKDNEESGISKRDTISKLNVALLTSAENTLNKVDWDKYR